MPGIPWALQIRFVHRGSGHAMAAAAQFVDLVCGHPAWILYGRVVCSGSMTRFATDAQLGGYDGLIYRES